MSSLAIGHVAEESKSRPRSLASAVRRATRRRRRDEVRAGEGRGRFAAAQREVARQQNGAYRSHYSLLAPAECAICLFPSQFWSAFSEHCRPKCRVEARLRRLGRSGNYEARYACAKVSCARCFSAAFYHHPRSADNQLRASFPRALPRFSCRHGSRSASARLGRSSLDTAVEGSPADCRYNHCSRDAAAWIKGR